MATVSELQDFWPRPPYDEYLLVRQAMATLGSHSQIYLVPDQIWLWLLGVAMGLPDEWLVLKNTLLTC